MKSTILSKSLLLAGVAFALGNSTVFAAIGDWTTIPGSACLAEDRASVASFIAPGSAEIMLKAGEDPQWVVCPVPRDSSANSSEQSYDITVNVDKSKATTDLYCYSSILQDDGATGSWHEIGGVAINQNLSGVRVLNAPAAGVGAAGVTLAVVGDGNAVGVACLIAAGDKIISVTVKAVQ